MDAERLAEIRDVDAALERAQQRVDGWAVAGGNDKPRAAAAARLYNDRAYLADEVVRLRAELAEAQGKVARVEAVREKYRQNMKRLAGSMTLSYSDPYQVNQTAFLNLDRALSGGPS